MLVKGAFVLGWAGFTLLVQLVNTPSDPADMSADSTADRPAASADNSAPAEPYYTSVAPAEPYSTSMTPAYNSSMATLSANDAAVWNGSVGSGLVLAVILVLAVYAGLTRVREWKNRGALLRARIVAAVRAPGADVLALLTEAGSTDFGVKYCLDGDTCPEWAEVLTRTTAEDDGDTTDEDLKGAWNELPPLMRSAGASALSPWVKYTHNERSYYKGDNPLETSLVAPPEGVRQEAEIGMPGLSMLGESWWEELLLPDLSLGARAWESEYFDLDGPGRWSAQQDRLYKCKTRAKMACWSVLFGGVAFVLFCWAFVYIDCGEHGDWGIGSCDCTDGYAGDRCDVVCHCGGSGVNTATTVGSCGSSVSCSTCSDRYVGEYCQLAPVYIISGAADDRFDGRYERLAAECHGKRVYHLRGGHGYVLFQPTDRTSWMVSDRSHITSEASGFICEASGFISSSGNGGSCTASPDGGGCAELWQDYDGSAWQDVPSLAVDSCPAGDPCCGIDCGTNGTGLL